MSVSKPVGPELQSAALALLRDVLNVQSGETFLVTTDANADPSVARAVTIAAHLIGAKPMQVMLDPPLPLQGLLADPFIPEPLYAAVQKTDVWFDHTLPYMAGSKAFDDVMHNRRTRYFLAAGMTGDAMIRMYGKVKIDDIIKISDDFQKIFDDTAGKQIRITSPAGTDVTFQILALPKIDSFQISKATKPGGYFAPAVVGFVPDPETVKGRIVVEAVLHDYYTVLPEPIWLELDGKIQSVGGGGTELAAMDRALRRAANGGYGDIVHFSCGMHPAARFTGTCFAEDTRVIGTNAIGFGLPPGVPGGGENHPDGVIRNQSIWIDDEQVVKDGTVIAPFAIAKALQDSAPKYG